LATDNFGNLYVADNLGNAIYKVDQNGTNSTFAEFDLTGPHFLAFGPKISAPLISISSQAASAPLENSLTDTIIVTRSGSLNGTDAVRVYTVDPPYYSPERLEQGFFGQNNTNYFYSTNDVLFQDAIRGLPGKDYQSVSMDLIFGPGEISKMVSIPILNNNAYDGRRSFAIALKPLSSPLTVGPNLTETILDDEPAAEITALAALQTSIDNQSGTRTFSCSLTTSNLSSSSVGPLRIRLIAHPGYNNPAPAPTNDNPNPTPPPTPPPPADVELGTFIVAPSVAAHSSVSTAVTGQIPAPQGDAFGYNLWWWCFAKLEQQINGSWFPVSAPWLVVDGVRLTAGYVNPDGSTTERGFWFGNAGANGGTPGYQIGGNGNTGSVGGVPSPSPTPVAGFIPFNLDGQGDFIGLGTTGAGYLQNSGGIQLLAAARHAGGRTFLYVATQSCGTDGAGKTDNFIFVLDPSHLLASATADAPWAKSGKIAANVGSIAFLAGESSDYRVSWYSKDPAAQCAKSDSTTGMMEGVIDLGAAFGAVPQTVYIAAAAYQTNTGGILVSQSPSGNNNGNIDPSEFVSLPISALMDQNADGKYDRLDPGMEFRLTGQRTASGQPATNGNDFTVTWPAYPGKTYQVYWTDGLTNAWHAAVNGLFVAPTTPPFTDAFSYTDPNVVNSGHRFYKVQIQ
jgi:hypothetical protein